MTTTAPHTYPHTIARESLDGGFSGALEVTVAEQAAGARPLVFVDSDLDDMARLVLTPRDAKATA